MFACVNRCTHQTLLILLHKSTNTPRKENNTRCFKASSKRPCDMPRQTINRQTSSSNREILSVYDRHMPLITFTKIFVASCSSQTTTWTPKQQFNYTPIYQHSQDTCLLHVLKTNRKLRCGELLLATWAIFSFRTCVVFKNKGVSALLMLSFNKRPLKIALIASVNIWRTNGAKQLQGSFADTLWCQSMLSNCLQWETWHT
jgi:hypothetical protein